MLDPALFRQPIISAEPWPLGDQAKRARHWHPLPVPAGVAVAGKASFTSKGSVFAAATLGSKGGMVPILATL